MTPEQKDLLFKDLCARLPYGVKYIRDSWNFESDQEMSVIETLDYIDKDGYISHIKVYKVEDIKPCLFPISSMTEEQMKEALSTKHKINLPSGKVMYLDSLNTYEFYDKNHIDYRGGGLIPLGLARDATNLNIY